MLVHRLAGSFVALFVLAVAVPERASHAQVVIGPGGGVSVYVPGVGVRLGAPRIYAPPYGRFRGAIVAPYGANWPSGRLYGGEAAIPGSRGLSPLGLPSAAELQGMPDAPLFRAAAALARQLDVDLTRFDTGDTWQRYLGMSDEAFAELSEARAVTDVDSLAETVARFERTSANPKFAQISGLPSFTATHAALAEVVGRASSGVEAGADDVPPAMALRIPPAAPTPPTAAGPPTTAPRRDARRGIVNRNAHAQGRREPAGDVAGPEVSRRSRETVEELPAPSPTATPAATPGVERSIIAD